MPLRIGEIVPDGQFEGLDGSKPRLRDFAGKPLILIFLRHLA